MGPAFKFRGGFGEIADGPLCIFDVLHKTFVDVEGTEAAAATTVIMGRSAGPAGYNLRADHPFLCAIRDERTGAILFMGAIYDPKRA